VVFTIRRIETAKMAAVERSIRSRQHVLVVLYEEDAGHLMRGDWIYFVLANSNCHRDILGIA
jgi:hypothetical protein